MPQHVDRVRRRLGMTEVEPEVAAESEAAKRDRAAVGDQGSRQPVRTARLRAGRRESVLIEDMRGAGGQRRQIPDGANDDERMNLQAGVMGAGDEVAQRIEA